MDNTVNGSAVFQSHEFCFFETTSRMFPFDSFQVGDFYEAIGIDACILVEYAGLNPFGGLRSDSVPKAGCPVVVHHLSLSAISGCLHETAFLVPFYVG